MLFKLPTCSSARASMVSPIAAFDHKTAKNRNPKYQRIRQSKHWEIPSKMFCIKITMVIKMGRCGFKISNNPYLWEISQSLGDCWPPQKKTVMQWFPDNNKGHSNKHESRYGVHLSMDCFIRRPLHFHWALFQNIPKCMTQTRTWRRIFFCREVLLVRLSKPWAYPIPAASAKQTIMGWREQLWPFFQGVWRVVWQEIQNPAARTDPLASQAPSFEK